MAEITRFSVLAVKEEVTEGTPVIPTAATDFVALQEGYELNPNVEVIETTELRSSIGASKPILGLESPEASISHYLRGSGTQGVEADFDLFLKAAFGDKEVLATEYDTTGSTAGTSSVRGTLVLGGGEGVNYERGAGVLIKDGTNGYRLRAVHSVSTDTLNLSFNLPAAPANGTNLGKYVLYKPGTSYPTLTLWDYRGNGGALQTMAGARVTEYSVDANAGELINQNFSFGGTGFYFDPINITATDTKLDFTDDDGTWVATVTAKLYKDPHDLASALQTAMQAANAGETPTVTYSDTTGKFTIKTTGTVLSLLWNTGANTANTIGDKIGFSTAADDTGTAATTGYTSDNAQSWAAPYTPTYDSNANAVVAKNDEVMLGDFDDYVCFSTSDLNITLSNEKTDIRSHCAESGVEGSVISARTVSVTLRALLVRHEADKFKKFRTGENTQFQYSWGEKSGGNWVAGKCGLFYLPSCTIQSFQVTDDEGLVRIDMELAGYILDGDEIYLNFM